MLAHFTMNQVDLQRYNDGEEIEVVRERDKGHHYKLQDIHLDVYVDVKEIKGYEIKSIRGFVNKDYPVFTIQNPK